MPETHDNVFIVLHNTHSAGKLVETAQVIYGLGFTNFIITKAEGSAAQSGVPDVNKLALKMKRRFMVLPDLKDMMEILQVEKPLLVASPVLTKERLDLEGLQQQFQEGQKIVLVISGSNSSFSRKEMDLGVVTALKSEKDLGPPGTAAVILYALKAAKQV